MVTVDRLLGVRGNVRSILNLPETDVVKWSDAEELARLEVISALQFDGFIISAAKIGLDFVACDFNRCEFRESKTTGHLWGAKSRWIECVFDRCDLREMIAPVNSFKRCRFEFVSIENFRPHQTLFEDCSFSRGTIAGLKAHLISNSQIVNTEMKGGGGQVLFRGCRFERMLFHQCYFEGAVFQRCTFADTETKGCRFDGITSDNMWWSPQQSDPFAIFLTNALDLIREKCGRNSAAYREFEAYTIDYGSGKTASQNFSACLYNDRVPYEETQKIIKDLRQLVASFPF